VYESLLTSDSKHKGSLAQDHHLEVLFWTMCALLTRARASDAEILTAAHLHKVIVSLQCSSSTKEDRCQETAGKLITVVHRPYDQVTRWGLLT